MEIFEKSTIIKRKLRNNFTMIPNELIDSKTISLKAKGLMCFLLRQPDDFVIYKTELHTLLKESRDGVITPFNELIEAGYILAIKTIVGETGRFYYSYIIYDEPVTADGSPLRLYRNGETVDGNTVTVKAEPIYNVLNTNTNNTNTNTKKENKKEKVEDPIIAKTKEFYTSEHKKAHLHEQELNYKSFVQYLFLLNPLKEPQVHILKIPRQVTFAEFCSLMADVGINGLPLILGKLEVMINTPKYTKGKQSLYLTLKNWLKP